VNSLRVLLNLSAVALALFSAAGVTATPPADVARDVSDLRIMRMLPTVSSMPSPLRRALARAFQQRRLEMANPGAWFRTTGSFTYAGDPDVGLPQRRLLFAFETPRHYFVYYEAAHPSHAAALAFRKAPVEFVWGGADLITPYARSPQRLRARILRHQLLDDRHYFW
jgi:hypothetical protein